MSAALDLLERATQRLRSLPAAALAKYYGGALPFWLALLWFWADMSTSPLAPGHLAPVSLGVAAGWLWMQTWRSVFAGDALCLARGEAPEALTPRHLARVAARTCMVAPSGLFALPLALLCVAPFAWVHTFYQHATVCRDEGASVWDGVRAAALATRTRPLEHHAALGLLSLVGVVVFLNALVVLWFLPELIHVFTGLESELLLGGFSPLNSTVLAVAVAVTALVVDPLVLLVSVERSFEHEVERSGRDLELGLRRAAALRAGSRGPGDRALGAVARRAVLALGLAAAGPALAPGVVHARAAAPALARPVDEAPSVDQAALDDELGRTLALPEFAWRLPRDTPVEPRTRTWLDDTREWLVARIQDVVRGAGKLWRWLLGLDSQSVEPEPVGGSLLRDGARPALAVLAIACVLLAATLTLRRLRRPRPPAQPLRTASNQALDLDDPALSPDRAPAREWARLARELRARGEPRLALRALFLEVLAALGQAGMVQPKPSKTVADYEREVSRRASSLPVLRGAFTENARLFEAVWYGQAPATEEVLQRFVDNARRIETGAEA